MSGLPFVIITCLRPVVNSDEARVLCSFAYWVSAEKPQPYNAALNERTGPKPND
jgi:hypothetical protein